MPTGLLIMKTVFEIMKLRKPAQSHNRNTRRRCEICSKLTIKTPLCITAFM